ncbi:MAG TPA: DUF2442 domain-containing protein [Phycisphaerales bacterium]|nr:DUF2442 domain-containing protein [Phycisphaerales bacterium]
MVRIASASAEPGYVLALTFTDGTAGRVNLAHLVGKGVFAAWRDPAFFAGVQVDPKTRTVCWPGGIDLDPDVLHARAMGKPLPGTDSAAA